MRRILRKLAVFIAIAGGTLGLGLALLVIYEDFRTRGVFLGLVLFPLILAYFPFYELFVYDSWNLFLLVYGSLGVSWLLLSMADPRERLPRSAFDEPRTKPVVTKESPAFTIVLLLIGGLLVAAILSSLSHS